MPKSAAFTSPVLNGRLWAFDAGDKTLWKRDLNGALATTPAYLRLDNRRILAVGDSDGEITGLDANDGKTLWTANLGGPIGNALVATREVFAGANAFERRVARRFGLLGRAFGPCEMALSVRPPSGGGRGGAAVGRGEQSRLLEQRRGRGGVFGRAKRARAVAKRNRGGCAARRPVAGEAGFGRAKVWSSAVATASCARWKHARVNRFGALI